ncbi:response regulator [Mucilaginibacter sp. CAU 1740]|uniref:response regulator n=1 Tax=Mucilaginibacter sp. CAU 1740 TaxID=3140365 RepID=UPI00325B9BB3
MDIKLPSSVMLIDDDVINNYIAEKLLKKVSHNIQVSMFSNAPDALEQLKKSISGSGVFPEVIFLDLMMRPMDGWEFLDHFATLKLPSPIRMVILSSSVFRHDMERAAAHPVENVFVSKPLSVDRLYELFGVI